MDDEIWKDIPNYEGLYQVSSKGRVKGLKRVDPNGRSIKPKNKKLVATKDGYLTVSLNKFGVCRTFRVHRLVAQAFILNPNSYPQVHHINENKIDNRIENLMWCSPKFNVRDYHLRRQLKLARYSELGLLEKVYQFEVDVKKDGFTIQAIRAAIEQKRYFSEGKFWKRTNGNPSQKISIKRRTVKKSILQVDLNGKVVKEWESLSIARRAGFNGVSHSLKDPKRICKGYYWVYKKEFENWKPIGEPAKRVVTPVLQLNKDGAVVKYWESVYSARKNGFPRVWEAVKKPEVEYKGFYWRYSDVN